MCTLREQSVFPPVRPLCFSAFSPQQCTTMDIYCPKCEWEPPASAEWTCECGHSWHTFDTHGQCPECGKVWRETQCHECTVWSPHHDWYHDLPPVDVDEITEGEEAAS